MTIRSPSSQRASQHSSTRLQSPFRTSQRHSTSECLRRRAVKNSGDSTFSLWIVALAERPASTSVGCAPVTSRHAKVCSVMFAVALSYRCSCSLGLAWRMYAWALAGIDTCALRHWICIIMISPDTTYVGAVILCCVCCMYARAVDTRDHPIEHTRSSDMGAVCVIRDADRSL